MSILSKAINKILPGAPSKKLNKLLPVAAMFIPGGQIIAGATGLSAGVSSALYGAGVAAATGGNPIIGAITGGIGGTKGGTLGKINTATRGFLGPALNVLLSSSGEQIQPQTQAEYDMMLAAGYQDVTPAQSEYKKVLDDMLDYTQKKGDKVREATLADIESSMQRRGIRTSGIHQEAINQSMSEIEAAAEAERLGLSLDIWKAKTATELELAAQQIEKDKLALAAQGNLDALSMFNQEQRGKTAEAVGGFLTSAIMPTAQKWISGLFNKSAPSIQPSTTTTGLGSVSLSTPYTPFTMQSTAPATTSTPVMQNFLKGWSSMNF